MLRTHHVNLQQAVNRSHALTGKLTYWWRNLPGMQGGDTVRDLCGMNHGTWNAQSGVAQAWTGTRHRTGGRWGSWYLDGINETIDVDQFIIESTCTVAFWVLFDSGPNDVILGSSSPDYFPYIDATNVNIRNGGGTVSVAHNGINTGEWYHLCLAQNPTDGYEFYKNGVSQGNGGGSSTRTPTINCIGGYSNQQFEMTGELDDIRVWQGRCLTANEVRQLYDESMQTWDPSINWSRFMPSVAAAPPATTAPQLALLGVGV